ncbi:MAG: trypsin-like serine protease [Calditrichaeota bacterium]|nr:trypsin-like serine protease [Calditrichota bacterium]
MKSRLIYTLSSLLLFSFTTEIVRRHDRNDADYLALGAQYPAVCKVGVRGGDGTLIAPQWVITAGHVAEGMQRREGKNLSVYFNGEAIRVRDVFIHPDFQPLTGVDLGLLLLEKPVQSIEPIGLYSKRDESGKQIVIVGHGDTKSGLGGDWLSDGKRRAATNLVDETSQRHLIFDFDQGADATELEGTAGRGDSGGPAIITMNGKNYLAGISSAGLPGQNGPGSYGSVEHYTRVSSYIDWIRSTMQNPQRTRTAQADNRVVRGGPQDGPLPGLGLFLMQDGDQIRIGGKADPEVPKAFRQVMFKPPSFILSLNGQSYKSLEQFKAAFAKLARDEVFTIRFSIQGAVKDFEGRKM